MRTPRRVVTLPPGLTPRQAQAFARDCRARGMDVLELRTDLHPEETDAAALAALAPLLVAERTSALSASWLAAATLVDVPLPGTGAPGAGAAEVLVSEHFAEPMPLAQALKAWEAVPEGVSVKHVEPLGAPERLGALLQLQAELQRPWTTWRRVPRGPRRPASGCWRTR
jgi:hypothetical protein